MSSPTVLIINFKPDLFSVVNCIKGSLDIEVTSLSSLSNLFIYSFSHFNLVAEERSRQVRWT